VRRGFLPIVPAVVFVEWWRTRTDIREQILAAVVPHAVMTLGSARLPRST
jgi:hypothetical protein